MKRLAILALFALVACSPPASSKQHSLGAFEYPNTKSTLSPAVGLVAVNVGGGDVAQVCRGFIVGGAGNIAVDTADGSTNVLITAPAVGVIHWIAVTKFRQTGTTATGIVAVL